jgi:hypothetical protein
MRIYAQAAAESTDPVFLRDESRRLYDDGDIDASAQIALRFLTLDESRLSADALIAALRMFIDTGMNDAVLPQTADALFALVDRSAQARGDRDIAYLRALHEEHQGAHRDARDRYAALLAADPTAPIADELRARISYLDRYHLRSPGTADEVFTTMTAASLLSRGTGKGTAYADAIVTSVLGGSEQLLGDRQRVKPHFSCVGEGDLLRVDAVSGDSDTGSLLMSGTFLWGGDIGEDLIMSNVPTIDVRYVGPGFKVMTLVREVGGGIAGYDAALIAVYRPSIVASKTRFSRSEPVILSLDMVPYISPRLCSVRWQIKEHPNLSMEGSELVADIAMPGVYTFLAEVSIFGKQCAKVERTVTVE